jgi:hypothetical protein
MKNILLILLAVVFFGLLFRCSLGNRHSIIDEEKKRYGINVHVVTIFGVDTTDPKPIFESKAQKLCPNGHEIFDINRSYDIFTGATYHYVIQCK